MKKIVITKNLIQYQFPPFKDQQFGFNIYALIHENKALLIDTAFEEHAAAVKADLHKQHIEITEVIFSHFHPDHTSGLPVLDSPKLHGNGLYQVSLDQYTPKEKHHYFKNMNTLTESSTLVFGEFKIQFKLIQGHVICGMFTVINDKFVHVADDIIASNEGVALLPSVNINNAKQHIDSLELLKDYSSHTLLLSHGNALSGEAVILNAIEQRQKYLTAVLKSEKPISVEEALKDCQCEFLHQEWHNYLYN